MKSAIYPGSFDPITNGHVDIIKRALNIFDKLHIAVLNNSAKDPLFSVERRLELIRDVFGGDDRIEVGSFSGLLVEYAKQQQASAIVRGLRAVSDFDYEFQIALTNRKLDDELDTVFFMTDEKYAYLSSSIVKQVSVLGGDVSAFVPDVVEQALKGVGV